MRGKVFSTATRMRLLTLTSTSTFALGLALVLPLVLLGSPAARAHDMWIVPSSFAVEPGERVAVRLLLGHAETPEAVVRDDRRIVRFEAVALAWPDGGAIGVPGLEGHEPAGYLRPVETGPLALVYESTAAFSELPAARFNAYLREEGLDGVRAWRRRLGEEASPGRELYSRSLKSLVRVGPGVDPADGTDRAVGLPLELVLDPIGMSDQVSGDHDVRLRLLWQGEPLAGALIDLVPLDGQSGRTRALRSGPDGVVRVALAEGSWLASCVHAERTTGVEALRAQWRTVFASLTFAVESP